jgi:hypothetical protein
LKRAQKGRSMRNLCNQCGKKPVAINYYKEGKPFYRSKCDHCAKGRKSERPLWALAGYKKKLTCDKCGHTSKYFDQFDVYYVDGDPKNCKFTNLKTVCANCQRILHKLKLPWRQGDLRPDF